MDVLLKAKVIRDFYVKAKNYVMSISQDNKALAASDINDRNQIILNILKDYILEKTDDAFHGNGWAAVENTGSNQNNLKLTGGMAYPGGWQSYLDGDVVFDNIGSIIIENNIHSISSQLSTDTLVDKAAKWKVGELIGRKLRPSIGNATTFDIIGNSETSITINTGNMTLLASVGNNYLVELSIPPTLNPSGVDRYDTVWLNTYPVEVSEDGAEGTYKDGDLTHPIKGGLELERRIKVKTVIHIQEDTSTYGDYSATYQDLDGVTHYMMKVASLERVYNDDTIITSMIIDVRSKSMLGRLVDILGISDSLKNPIVYSSTKFIKNTMDFETALGKLDEVLFASGTGDLGNVADKVGEDVASPLTPGSIPDYSGVGSSNYAIDEGSPHRTAIAVLDKQAELISGFLGRDTKTQGLPAYPATPHNYISANDQIDVAIGKLDVALEVESVARLLELGVSQGEQDAALVASGGADLIGVDPSGIVGTAQVILQSALEEIAHRRVQDKLTIATLNVVPVLSKTPVDGAQVIFMVESLPQENGTDFTISVKTITWVFGTAGFNLSPGDICFAVYDTREA